MSQKLNKNPKAFFSLNSCSASAVAFYVVFFFLRFLLFGLYLNWLLVVVRSFVLNFGVPSAVLVSALFRSICF